MIPDILAPLGYGTSVIDDVVVLVRHHLLLGDMATSADPEDPATVRSIVDAVHGDSNYSRAFTCSHRPTRPPASRPRRPAKRGRSLERMEGHSRCGARHQRPARDARRIVRSTRKPKVGTVFESLSDRITGSFKNLRSKGRLSASDVEETVSEIRRALLDADVALPVVRSFTAPCARRRPVPPPPRR